MERYYEINLIDLIKEIGKILIWLGFITSVILAYFYYLKFRNKERSLLIEKGIDLTKIREKRKFPGFLIGITLLGLAIGGVIALLVGSLFNTSAIVMIPVLLLFGAIGVIVGHIFDQKK